MACDVLSIPNGNGNVPDFNSVVIQGNNPHSPVYYSSGTTFSFNPVDGGGVLGATLEVTRIGVQWGSIYNPQSGLYYLSRYENKGSLRSHCWDVVTLTPNEKITLQDDGSNPHSNMFRASVFNSAGALVTTSNCDATGKVEIVIASAGTYYFTITYSKLNSEKRYCSVRIGGDNAAASTLNPYVLKKLPFANFKYISSRSDRLRMNSTGLLMTCVMPEIYEGGSIQAGKIISSVAPESDYSSYLYTLRKKYLGKLKEGCYGMWFPTGSEWLMGPDNDDYFNFVQNDSVFNMYLLDYSHPNGSNLSSLDMQLKVDGWMDYTTNDTTIPQIPGIVFPDEWLTAVSALEALFIFTDNPNHNKIKR